jgi:transcriptional regulator with XRE-family HTH domain
MTDKQEARSIEVGARLKEMREAHGMSMRALAQRSGHRLTPQHDQRTAPSDLNIEYSPRPWIFPLPSF